MQPTQSDQIQPDEKTNQFYRHALTTLIESGVPFLVGGAYALRHYTGIGRHTKDFDIFIRPEDCDRALGVLAKAGYRTEVRSPIWLAKAFSQEDALVDVIFSSGNGIARVDEAWFTNASEGEIWGVPVKFCPAEEIIWSKAYVMERERYDGADIMHLIRACGEQLDWARLLQRFGPHWRILLNYFVLFGFVYPGERSKIPSRVMQDLLHRALGELESSTTNGRVCQGTLISRTQYRADIERWGYKDGRLPPSGVFTPEEIAQMQAELAKESEPGPLTSSPE